MSPSGAAAIDAALVGLLVDSQFPAWSNLAITPVEPQGWDNRSFRLGSELVVRLASADGFPYRWSVYRWLEGEPASAPRIVWTLLPGASRDRFRAELGVRT